MVERRDGGRVGGLGRWKGSEIQGEEREREGREGGGGRRVPDGVLIRYIYY